MMVTFWCVFDFSQSNITFQISWVNYRPALQNFLCKEISWFYVSPPQGKFWILVWNQISSNSILPWIFVLFYRNVLKLSRRIDLHKRSRHHVCCKLCWNIFCKETAGFQGCCSHSLHNTLSPLDSRTRITASPRQWGLSLSCRHSVKQMNQLAPKTSNSQTARLTFSSLVMRNVLQPLTWQCFKLFQKVNDSPTPPQKKRNHPSITQRLWNLKSILRLNVLLWNRDDLEKNWLKTTVVVQLSKYTSCLFIRIEIESSC